MAKVNVIGQIVWYGWKGIAIRKTHAKCEGFESNNEKVIVMLSFCQTNSEKGRSFTNGERYHYRSCARHIHVYAIFEYR